VGLASLAAKLQDAQMQAGTSTSTEPAPLHDDGLLQTCRVPHYAAAASHAPLISQYLSAKARLASELQDVVAAIP
jgi:hypothetical protein